jgi:hypothetical protein
MKYFNKIQISLAVLALFAFLSCSKEGSYTLEDTPPLDFRSYYNGLTVTFANATEGATDISWNFGDGTADVSGDSVVHVYSETGNYVITMDPTMVKTIYSIQYSGLTNLLLLTLPMILLMIGIMLPILISSWKDRRVFLAGR